MTADGLAGDGAGDQMAGPSAPLRTEAILGLCDGLLKEIGRRSHLFAWLRAPDGGNQGWLVVDGYYPGHRLVVICRDEETEFEHLYAELVPSHGLHLLRLAPSSLGVDLASVKLALTRLIDELPAHAERSPPGSTEARRSIRALDLEDAGPPREGPMARVAASFTQAAAPRVSRHRPLGPSQAAAAERAARFVEARKLEANRSAPRSPPRPPAKPSKPRSPVAARQRPPKAAGRERERGAPLVPVALTLVVVLGAEVAFGIGKVGLVDGHLLLAFGIALDACARALGTVAAIMVRNTGWSWWCALGGSPAVAAFALFRPEGPSSADPAPLAGLLSMLAVFVIAVALLTLLL